MKIKQLRVKNVAAFLFARRKCTFLFFFYFLYVYVLHATATTTTSNINVICLEHDAYHELVDQVVARLQEKLRLKEAGWITGDEAMEMLKIGKSTLQKLRDTGSIRFSQMERKHILYDRLSLEEYIQKNVKDTF